MLSKPPSPQTQATDAKAASEQSPEAGDKRIDLMYALNPQSDHHAVVPGHCYQL